MNNLLRTLTDSPLYANGPEPNLKLLLNAVKEARKQCNDAKPTDAFYESLDGLLQDLRTVTMDNRDPEAFLKPVLRSEVPDYYDVIMHPMDLQTMQKKVKQKHYKSKREFKDDLDLIWSNCFTYNATENHPLRQCASRLKAKAEKLLKNITDRKERVDPPIPSDLSRGATPKLNGAVNGHVRPRPVAFTKSPSPVKPLGPSNVVAPPRRDAPFADTAAISRTAEGMADFAQLDRELDVRLQNELTNGFSGPSLKERLRHIIGLEVEVDHDDVVMGDGEVGDKRKLSSTPEDQPRKRARLGPSDKGVVELWWDAMQTDSMIGNALPVLRHASSEEPSTSTTPGTINDPPRKAGQRPRKKRRKQDEERMQKSLLHHMNNNIRTVRRVRDTHARLSVLKDTNAEDGAGAGGAPPEPLPPPPLDDIGDTIDDRLWSVPSSGLEVGEQNADGCMHWMGSKVLEHAGFQGSSKVALDVLAGVTADYLLNVGRTLRFMCDKYAKKMTSEEIILHTLFESGVTRIHDLERYIKEDIVRYGSRMTDLEKKLRNAYTEATADQAWDDEALFKMEDDEEEDSEFVMGNFADTLGDDFLGLRELGIAAEFGLSSLSVPKKLLKGKNKGNVKDGAAAAKPSEPPPPFPPPPAFVPLDTKSVEDQIGLLKPYYHSRLAVLSASSAPPASNPPIPPPFASQIPGTFHGVPYQSMPPPVPHHPFPPLVTLPDDTPTQVQTKIGPLGQVLKPNPSANSSKKKAPPKPKLEADVMMNDQTPAATPAATAPETPKKAKATPTKKKKPLDALPPVIMAAG